MKKNLKCAKDSVYKNPMRLYKEKRYGYYYIDLRRGVKMSTGTRDKKEALKLYRKIKKKSLEESLINFRKPKVSSLEIL